MSYNISSTKTLLSTATITAGNVRRLLASHRDDLPGDSFLETMNDELERRAKNGFWVPDDQVLPLANLTWRLSGSGHAFNLLTKTIAPHIRGRIEVVFVWEGGDSLSGLIVDNGVATECNVDYTLIPRKASAPSIP